jgi:hypothetical protein
MWINGQIPVDKLWITLQVGVEALPNAGQKVKALALHGVESTGVYADASRRKSQKLGASQTEGTPPMAKKKSFPDLGALRNLVVLPPHSYHLNSYICACTMD